MQSIWPVIVDEHVRRKISAACGERGVEIRPAGMNQRDLGTSLPDRSRGSSDRGAQA